MQGKHRVSAIPPSRHPSSRLRKPTSKELDLFLLAGCSCLLTVLYHPVAHALQTHVAQSSASAIATQTSNASAPNSANAFHLIVPSRDEVKEEEDS